MRDCGGGDQSWMVILSPGRRTLGLLLVEEDEGPWSREKERMEDWREGRW